MVSFYEVIDSRRTVREYKDKSIPIKSVKRWLECGLKAPSNDHTRRWEFILLDDKSVKIEIFGERGENNLKLTDPQKRIDDWNFIFEDSIRTLKITRLWNTFDKVNKIQKTHFGNGSSEESRFLSNVNNNITFFMASINISMAFYNILKSIFSIDNRFQLSLFNHIL